MVIWGRTILVHHLAGWHFAAYWILCVVLATAAVTLAIVDIFVIRRRLRGQQQELITRTLDGVRDRPPK